MKRKYSFIFLSQLKAGLLLTCILMSVSCGKKFLEVSPQGSLTDALFPQNAADALLATNAVYGSFHNWSYWSGGFPILDIMSDDANKGSNPGDAARLVLFDNFQFSPTASDIFPWYSALYQSVKSANVVIEKIPPIVMDESLKKRYIAEARFLRAMFYFNLVRAFGDVVKVTTVIADPNLTRSPKDEIYNEVIIPDLLFAIDNLPEQSDYAAEDVGRASRGAAKSLLAKVYLYQKDFVNAEKYSLEVINSGQYTLESDFANAFSLAGQFGAESVFEIGSRPLEGDLSQGANQFANTQGVRGNPNKGWGFNRPSVNLMNSFEPGDKRRDATIIFLGETIDGVPIVGDVSTPDTTWSDSSHTIISEIETYNQKVWVPGTTTAEEWGYNIRVIRYAEVLLIAAEALNEDGQGNAGLPFLNMVRERAGLNDITETDQTLLRQIIRNERRYELAMEGDRFFDLVRTGQAAQVLGPLGFVVGKNELFPLPQSEIDLSGGRLTQNPGW
ncbi:MAG TPA: RagB/SusD family nutrient uptake outer membrane protein [Chitinophagales bacterium]|nr:RagB/SusD family nutrient uptake outer membrane protein [Chitinophagales bacterium]